MPISPKLIFAVTRRPIHSCYQSVVADCIGDKASELNYFALMEPRRAFPSPFILRLLPKRW